jgi:transcriptional regulator with XRE-family HTH domain
MAKVSFAIALHDARTKVGLTQQQLASKLGHSQPYVAKLEGGEANPTLAAIGSMLAGLGLRIVMRTASIKPEMTTLTSVAGYVCASGQVDASMMGLTSEFYTSQLKRWPRASEGGLPSESTAYRPEIPRQPELALPVKA